MCLISNVEIIFLWWQKEGTILTDLMGEHSRWINKCLYEILSMKRGGCFSRMRISQSQTWYVCSIAYVHIQLLHKVMLYVMPRISQSPKSQSLKEKKLKRFQIQEYDSESSFPLEGPFCCLEVPQKNRGADFMHEEAKLLSKANVNKFKIWGKNIYVLPFCVWLSDVLHLVLSSICA